MKKITYIFNQGRTNLQNNLDYSDDFFYGYRYLTKKNFTTEIIEFSNKFTILKKIEHLLSKYLSLPFYIFSLLTLNNYKSIKNSDHIILISESSGFAVLPLLIFLKKSKRPTSHLFIMGLYSKKINYSYLKFLHKFFIRTLHKYIDNFYILGKGELLEANRYKKLNNNILFSPFCIDTNFWTNDSKMNGEYILFIGNDGNRDYELLYEIAKGMQQFKFKIISNNEYFNNKNLHNIEVFNSRWGDGKITDRDLINFYKSAKLVILPLKNTSQPSGQSVALQSLSIGVPVIISKIEGFWDINKFQDGVNIFFEDKNTIESWINKINMTIYDLDKIKKTTNAGRKLVVENYDIENFNKFLLKKIK